MSLLSYPFQLVNATDPFLIPFHQKPVLGKAQQATRKRKGGLWFETKQDQRKIADEASPLPVRTQF
jgi:hypothetical protein